ncbi:MAG: peptidylprolyl isomerase [Aeromicrobium sp.]|nr:peptidylprolyl isomerase [Aeromicrobium sp.]
MRTLRGIAALVLTVALAVSIAGCSSPSADVVARVNGVDITRAEFDRLYAQIELQYAGAITEEQAPEYRKMVLDYMIESILVRQEAERLDADLSDAAVDAELATMMGADADPAEFEARVEEAGLTMEDLRNSVRDSLASEFLAEYAVSQSDATTVPDDYALLEHILVDEEALADELVSRIEAGEEFGALAEEYSTDTMSAVQGGSLGWAQNSMYVAEFAAAADALAVGGVSEPVQSDFGWHIIRKVDEVAAGSAIDEAPEELRAEIDLNSVDLALLEYVRGLREAAEIEYLDESLAQ